MGRLGEVCGARQGDGQGLGRGLGFVAADPFQQEGDGFEVAFPGFLPRLQEQGFFGLGEAAFEGFVESFIEVGVLEPPVKGVRFYVHRGGDAGLLTKPESSKLF